MWFFLIRNFFYKQYVYLLSLIYTSEMEVKDLQLLENNERDNNFLETEVLVLDSIFMFKFFFFFFLIKNSEFH